MVDRKNSQAPAIVVVTPDELGELIERRVAAALEAQARQTCPVLVDDAGAARALGVSVATLRRQLSPAGAPFVLVGDRRRWHVPDLLAWLKVQRSEAAE